MYTAVALFIGTLGIALSFKKMAGSPLIVVFSAIMFWGAIALVNNIDVSYVDDVQYSLSYPMNVTTGTTVSALSTTDTGKAEHPVNTNSLLYNTKISCILIDISKTGAPTGLATIGIFDVAGSTVKSFGTIDATLITTSQKTYTFCLPNHDYWIISSKDYIGLRHTGTAGNVLNLYRDTTNVYDSTNSVLTTFTSGTWTDSSALDVRMILTSDNSNVYGKSVPYDLNDNDFYVFFIMLGGFFMFIGVIIQMRDWT
jgi:hypothetical protein